MKAYITKYALTTGIQERDGEVSKEYPNAFKATKLDGEWFQTTTYWKPHWHTNRINAVLRARDMQAKAIKSAKKKLAKLRKMMFE